MKIPTIFTPQATEEAMERLNKLTFDKKPLWGKMNASQMLAHVNVAYELTYGERKTSLGPVFKFFARNLFKNMVVGEKQVHYPKNSRTAPDFKISGERDFETEKARFIGYLKTTQENGEAYFEGKENQSFGKMTAREWNNLFYKHMDHHFRQFGI